RVRQRVHVLDGDPERLDRRRRAAARDDPPAELVQAPGEFLEPGLVVDGDQRAHSSLTTSGRSLCSTALIRSWRLSGVSPGRTGTRSWRRTGPESTPSSTRCTVAPDSS